MSDTPAAVAKLARMANQIADAFSSQPREEAIAGIADHIAKFWTLKMRRDLAARLNAPDLNVHALAKAAFDQLERK